MKHSLRLFSAVALLMMGVVIASAQPRFEMKVTGTVMDSKTSEPLVAAVVKATSSNGGEGTFAITGEKGTFELTLSRPGKYTLEFSYLGYKTFSKDYNIRPGQANNIGRIKMEEDAVALKEAQVIGKNMRVKQTADTTIINADGYKVMEGASAEDLIAKMPGMRITESGVEAQGETVEKVLVDGKEFFENDPKLALKTLPAEVVQSVAVFDKKSDQAEFTGFDDGERFKALDVRTRSYKRNGVFGKITAQGGADVPTKYTPEESLTPRYNFNFNLNIFNGDRRVTLMGLSNNVNQRNFSFDDLMGAGMMGGMGGRMRGAQNGVAKSNGLGVNYNDALFDDRLEIQGSYFFNSTDTHQEDSTFSDYLTIDRRTEAYSRSDTKNLNHSMNMLIRFTPGDNDQIVFRPRFSAQRNSSTSSSRNYTISPLARDTASTSNETISRGDGYNVGGNLTWLHKLNDKGRVLSLGFNGTLSGSGSNSDAMRTINATYVDQNATNETNNYNYGADVTWTEPINENMQLTASLNMRNNHSESERVTTYDQMGDMMNGRRLDPIVRDSIDANLSNTFISDYKTQGANVGYRFHNDKLNVMARMELQRADLSGRQTYDYYRGAPGSDPSYVIDSKIYYNVMPMAMFEWTVNSGNSLNIFYRSSSSAPGINQLQQSVNNTNPLALSTGNPDLGQQQSHNINARFIHSNMEKATNLQFHLGGGMVNNPIGTVTTIVNTRTTVDALPIAFYQQGGDQFKGLELVRGAQITRPMNLSDNTYNLFAGLTYGLPFDLIMSNVNINLDGGYNVYTGVQEVVTADANGKLKCDELKTKSISRSIAPGLEITSNISQNLDFSLHYDLAFSDVQSNTNPRNYLTHSASGTFQWVIWKGITMEHSANYTYYTGSAMEGEDISTFLWNASLGKKFLNNALEVKISGYDILGTQRSYTRSVSDMAITTSYYNVMPRYAMLTIVYNLRSFKGVNTSVSEGGGMRGGMMRGGPGMMPF
ncbi:MAG: TonB-dependent receptor [Bacteroidaceae bacterium]|nr:TonB-dependent receptor [Bacteroidaceae bacterium]